MITTSFTTTSALPVSLPCIDENMRIQMYPLPRRALRHHLGVSYGIGDRRRTDRAGTGTIDMGSCSSSSTLQPQTCPAYSVLRDTILKGIADKETLHDRPKIPHCQSSHQSPRTVPPSPQHVVNHRTGRERLGLPSVSEFGSCGRQGTSS
jgi:hypothetical protein